MLIVWLGLGTKATWLWLRKYHVLPLNTWFPCLKSCWKNSNDLLNHNWFCCWCQTVICSLAGFSPRCHTIHHLPMIKLVHVLCHFRNVMICMKRTNVTYLWFAKTYNANIFFWWLSSRSLNRSWQYTVIGPWDYMVVHWQELWCFKATKIFRIFSLVLDQCNHHLVKLSICC